MSPYTILPVNLQARLSQPLMTPLLLMMMTLLFLHQLTMLFFLLIVANKTAAAILILQDEVGRPSHQHNKEAFLRMRRNTPLLKQGQCNELVFLLLRVCQMKMELLLTPLLPPSRRKQRQQRMLPRDWYHLVFRKKVPTTELSMYGLMSAIEPTS